MTASTDWGNRAFETRVSGKWVLAGEHAVLKGAHAVAMPHPETALMLRFEPGPGAFAVEPAMLAPVVSDLFQAAMLEAPVSGRLVVESSVPFGAGLGSSAALCVAFTRWVAAGLTELDASAQVEFATRLEDHFHGRSSGMDVATIAAGEPVLFARGKPAQPLGLRELPRFTFHDTGIRAKTSECVAQVEAYRDNHPDQASRVDARMAHASSLAVEGLRSFDRGDRDSGLKLVAQAMELGQACYDEWKLVPPSVAQLREDLLAQGALAVKLTGAGGGGFVVALWAR
jgi:mevalonate kinase